MADADPSRVGGPGQSAAVVAYPTATAAGSINKYNYKDTVNAEWFSWAKNSSQTTMQIWYWSPTFPNQQWQPMTKYVVPQNGTLAFDLSDGITDKLKAGGFYLGQWNLNFTRTDKAPVTGLTLSSQFNCSFDDSKAATTFSDTSVVQSTAAPSSTSSSSASTTTSSSADSTSSSASTTGSSAPSAGILGPNASAAAASATPMSSGISGGAIAGIVIAVLLAIALGAAGAFFFLRRKRRQDNAATPAGGFPPGPYDGAPAYKQQPMMGAPMGTPMGAPMAAGHYTPSQKSQYNGQEQYTSPVYGQGQHPQQYSQQQGGYVSELPGGYHQGQAPQQYSSASAITQELPTERYS